MAAGGRKDAREARYHGLYGKVIKGLEAEVLGRADITEPHEVEKYVGRANPPSFVLRPVQQPKGFNTGGPRSLTYHLKCLQHALCALHAAVVRALLPCSCAGVWGRSWRWQQLAARHLDRRLGEVRAVERRGVAAGVAVDLKRYVRSGGRVVRWAGSLLVP